VCDFENVHEGSSAWLKMISNRAVSGKVIFRSVMLRNGQKMVKEVRVQLSRTWSNRVSQKGERLTVNVGWEQLGLE